MNYLKNGKPNIVGELIVQFRKKNNITRQQFAKLADVSLSAIVSYELGTSNPNTLNAIKIAKVLEMDFIKFFSYIGWAKNKKIGDFGLLSLIIYIIYMIVYLIKE